MKKVAMERQSYEAIDPPARLKIIPLELVKDDFAITAQFNPKEVSVDTAVTYDDADGHLEFTKKHDALSSMAFEMFFDGFEKNESVVPMIQKLQSLTKKMKPTGAEARPPKVRIIWGAESETVQLPQMTVVVESVSVKYTMFSPKGEVLRATANIKVKECGDFRVGRKK